MSDFDDFIREQSASLIEEAAGLTLEQEKQIWIDNLNKLYELVKKSLQTHINEGNVQLSFPTIYLTEEQLGTYSVEMAHIKIGRNIVKLEPIGTFLIGVRGRLDMIGPRGSACFVIVPPESRKPRVRVTVTRPGDPSPPPEERGTPPEKWVWKIQTSPPHVGYIELDEKNFREALMGVVNG